jgi:hypothetical protein
MTDVAKHIPYFQKLFRNYRDDLANVLKEDKWLRDENIIVQFGEELEDEDLRKRSAKRKIEISTIYKYAHQLRKSVEDSLQGLPETAHESAQELIFPEIFLLHLLRVLFAIYPQNKELQRNIQTLEKDLGVSNAKKPGTSLDAIADSAKQMLGGILPGGLKLPSNEELNSKLEQAFKDPLVSETLGQTVNSLIGAKDLGEGIGLAMKSLENPKFMEGLMKAVQTFIPQETLDSIVKSTESLKESGEVKEALSKLGIPAEIDISKVLQNPSELLSSVLQNNTNNTDTPSSVEEVSENSPINIKSALDTLMKNNIPPEMIQALENMMKNPNTANATDHTSNPEKSLIDL